MCQGIFITKVSDYFTQVTGYIYIILMYILELKY